MSVWKKIAIGIIIVFALIGLVFTAVFIGMRFGIFNVRGSAAERNSFFGAALLGLQSDECKVHPCAWADTPEWAVVREGLMKDVPVIERAAAETGVSARLIAAAVVPEQLRFFTSDRETFKQVFEPLKILGVLSQFSLGVSGIKQETAAEIDRRRGVVTDPQVLFDRLTDPHDHYYSYLYTALFIKQIQDEWAAAGFPIDRKPAVAITLFNIGFENSHPNANPQSGGAPITIGDATYSFGDLGSAFYNSNELIVALPK